MPPKVKVTKEDIINAAVDIVRSSGAQSINARTVAATLNCSTQPIFSNFATMDQLRFAVSSAQLSVLLQTTLTGVMQALTAPFPSWLFVKQMYGS